MELENIFKDFIKTISNDLSHEQYDRLKELSKKEIFSVVENNFLNKKIEKITYMNIRDIPKKNPRQKKKIQNFIKLFNEYFKIKQREEELEKRFSNNAQSNQQLNQLSSIFSALSGGGGGGMMNDAASSQMLNTSMVMLSGIMNSAAGQAKIPIPENLRTADGLQDSMKKLCDDMDMVRLLQDNVQFFPKIFSIIMKEDISSIIDLTKIQFDPAKPYIENLRNYVNSKECESLIGFVENKVKEILTACGKKEMIEF